MPKGQVEQSREATTLVSLRENIRDLEVRLGDLKGRAGRDGQNAIEILRLRDIVEEAATQVSEQGIDIRPERTRIRTIDNIMIRQMSAMVSGVGRAGGYPTLRRQENPPEDYWWWYLDQHLAERQRKQLLRVLGIAAVVVVLALAVNFVLNRYFGLGPVEKETQTYITEGEQALMEGNIDGAAIAYEHAVATMPNSPQANVYLGAIYDKLGRTTESEQLLAKAEELFGSRVEYLTALARAYHAMGEYDTALETIEEALAIDPEEPQALLIRGGIHEAQGDYQAAVDDYERSSAYAQERGQDALYVVARMRMAMLMQQGSAGGIPAPGYYPVRKKTSRNGPEPARRTARIGLNGSIEVLVRFGKVAYWPRMRSPASLSSTLRTMRAWPEDGSLYA
jgi:tetratricopeptide (TPR) repeat protein